MSARLFIAVEIGAEDREALVDWAHSAVGEDRGMRVVAAEQVHLTLVFLGHRSPQEIDPLDAVVAGFAGRPAPPLRTAGALWLSPRRPHVLTVAVEDVSGGLAALHRELWDVLEPLGYERERRRFRPHLTVARVRHGWTAPTGALAPAPELALAAGSMVLMRSWLGGGPARYEALSRAALRAGS
ncbi:MAG TPA: RNA 2',3'-cyclic phosphodiesterase [Baekduia sp.]|nr:RNA 2',3'-cyclic phosphodiesterase [Baekduia sp.]